MHFTVSVMLHTKTNNNNKKTPPPKKKKKEAQSHSAALEVKKLEVKKLQVNRDVEEEKGLSWPLHALHFDIHV